ncbi:MAG TPA: hypothetical protein ENO03_04095, partial [Candidatus Aminicenantes bacterium]|nr:hypothetical protein [Candidatus Aminicenantes bacterium]
MTTTYPSRRIPRSLIYLAAAVTVLAGILIIGALRKKGVDSYRLEPIDLDYTILANSTVDYPEPLELAFPREG